MATEGQSLGSVGSAGAGLGSCLVELRARLRRKLTVVSAPPAFVITTLTGEWLASRRQPVGSLSPERIGNATPC
jgi:hypothetical protein